MKTTISALLVFVALIAATPAQARYTDGMNSYAGYHVMHGEMDPSGLKKFRADVEYGTITVESAKTRQLRSGRKYVFELSFDPNEKVCCERIAFIQLTRILNADGDVVFGRNEDYLRNRSTEDGWAIDQSSRNISPYYGLRSTDAKIEQTGESGNSLCSPGARCDANGIRGDGAYMSDHPGGFRNKVFQFVTYVTCARGEDAGKHYGVVTWGFAQDSEGNYRDPSNEDVTGELGDWAGEYALPEIRDPTDGDTTLFDSAADAWNEQAQQDDPSDRAHPRQETY